MYKCLLYYPIKRVENQSKKYDFISFQFKHKYTYTHNLIPFQRMKWKKQNKKTGENRLVPYCQKSE